MDIETALVYVLGAPAIAGTVAITGLIIAQAVRAMSLGGAQGTNRFADIARDK